jgi:cysteine desulfurase/selenocysteine lyase
MYMDVSSIRRDFPLLDREDEKDCPIYFDNACMTLRPRAVIDKIVEYYSEYPGCGGRSIHKISSRVTDEFEKAREIIRKYISAPDLDSVLFTKNTTEAINLIANTFPFEKGDLVLGTDHEHNSNLAPWLKLKADGRIRYKAVPSTPDLRFDIEAFKEIVKEARLVSMVHVSNLDGRRIPEKEIVEIAHDNKVPVVLDAAQSVPHMKVEMDRWGVDFLAFSGHKAMGPTGTGVLACRRESLEELSPFMVGGDTVKETTYEEATFLDPPRRYEAGLQHFSGFIGLGSALKYIEGIGPENIHEHEVDLNRYITKLFGDRITVMGPSDPANRSGIFPFQISGMNPHDIAMMLDEIGNIAIRSGMHCVHSWFKGLEKEPSARASFYVYNTRSEIDRFDETLTTIIKDFS